MSELQTFTAFCREANGEGTTWIQAVTAMDIDNAREAAELACAAAWGYKDVVCIGLAKGDITIEFWED